MYAAKIIFVCDIPKVQCHYTSIYKNVSLSFISAHSSRVSINISCEISLILLTYSETMKENVLLIKAGPCN